MYTPLNCPKQQCLQTTKPYDNIENVKDEIKYIFPTTQDERSNQHPKTQKINFQQLLQDPETIFNISRQLWHQAEDILESETANVKIPEVQGYIVDVLVLTRYTYGKFKDDLTDDFHQNWEFLKRSVMKFTDLEGSCLQKLTGSVVKQPDHPISQYFHLYLNILWLMFTVDDCKGVADVKDLMMQLAFISFKSYERSKKDFITCKCIKAMWLRIQLYCEYKVVQFWDTFNQVLECYNEGFVIQFLPIVAKLQCYDETGEYVGECNYRVQDNFEFLFTKWSALLKDNLDDGTLLGHMESIEFLLPKLWINCTRLDLLYATWDYFYRRLEDMKIDGELSELSEKIRGTTDLGKSYLFFLRILYRHIKRYKQHWNKFKGRIYTRFNNVKFTTLNDQGVFNLILLLIVIIEVGFDEINGKILEYLNLLSNERKNTKAIWKIYITLIEVNLLYNKNIDGITKIFIPLVQDVSANRNQFHLLSMVAPKLHTFITGNINMHLKQTTLIGTWIENYINCCQHSELSSFLNSLVLLVERVMETGAWNEYEESFNTYIIPSLKRLVLTGNNVNLIGTLGGLIVANSMNNINQIVTVFTSENVHPKVCCTFFCKLCKLVELPLDAEYIVVKAWFQCMLIGEYSADFIKIVLTLSITKPLNLSETTNLFQFLQSLTKSNDKKLIKACFDGSEKYIGKHLYSQNEKLIDDIYLNMAVVFTTCSQIIYNRSINNCLFSKFVDLLLLPMDILRGIRLSDMIMKSIEKTWHVYVKAIHSLLNNDAYLERILKDLIVKYIPLFQMKPTPLLKIMNNSELTTFALNKISLEFLLQNSSKNEHLYKVITFLNELLEQIDNLQTGNLIISILFPSILEVYMFKNQKLGATDGIKLIVKSDLYNSETIKVIIKKAIIDVTKKHLPFSTNNYFQMMYVLTKIIPREIKEIINEILTEIKIVERKRGQGFDNCLRIGFEKLQKLLK